MVLNARMRSLLEGDFLQLCRSVCLSVCPHERSPHVTSNYDTIGQ